MIFLNLNVQVELSFVEYFFLFLMKFILEANFYFVKKNSSMFSCIVRMHFKCDATIYGMSETKCYFFFGWVPRTSYVLCDKSSSLMCMCVAQTFSTHYLKIRIKSKKRKFQRRHTNLSFLLNGVRWIYCYYCSGCVCVRVCAWNFRQCI